MRFGAFVPQGWRWDLGGIPVEEQWPTMLSTAKAIEANGFESAWVFDHLQNFPPSDWADDVWKKATGAVGADSTSAPMIQEATHEAWTLMSALAATTETVRLGQMCTCNTYRPPSYLAKVASTIDVISGGRLEMGIGAGWYEQEHGGYGYPFLGPGGRLGMLREGVEIMKAMWTEDVVSYEGKYYQLKGAICEPKPVQDPHIPIWVAGGGEKVTLRIAAQHASYANFAGGVETFSRKSDILEGHCKDLGTDYDAIVRSANFNILCAETESAVEDKLGWLESHMGKFVNERRAARFGRLYRENSGTPEQVVARLEEWEAVGMSYAIVNFADIGFDRSSMELFAREVAPAFA